ncbi:uncharacterized protein METZ01_LOCUS187668, partial [marine metagenome]
MKYEDNNYQVRQKYPPLTKRQRVIQVGNQQNCFSKSPHSLLQLLNSPSNR